MADEHLSDQEQQRCIKLARLREAGVDPYPPRSSRTHTALAAMAALADLPEGAEPPVVTVAGRLVSIRVMGKSSFAHIEDASDRIQLYLRRDVLGDETYTLFKTGLDLGDFVEAKGLVFRTRTGVAARGCGSSYRRIGPWAAQRRYVHSLLTSKPAMHRRGNLFA